MDQMNDIPYDIPNDIPPDIQLADIPPEEEKTAIEVTVLGVSFCNRENGYTVLRVSKGRTEFSAVGVMPEIRGGEQCRLVGDWVEHPRFGRQFKCVSCTPILPTTERGIEAFLSSGIIRGVGKTMAKRIVNHFGEDTLAILNEDPERLREVPGIGKKNLSMIVESYVETVAIREAMVFLQQYGVSANLAQKISARYAQQTQALIRQNPYRLCEDIEGIGFQTADRIGMSMGIAPDAPARVSAAIYYVLQDASAASGHIYLPRTELISRAVALLRVDQELADHELDTLLLRRSLIQQRTELEDRIYLPQYEAAEREVAQRLLELLHAAGGGADEEQNNIAIDTFEEQSRISFSERQREAILSALSNGLLVITGGPGTGKTTIINCIISLLKHAGEEVLLCAPTGRAAKRMSEATGEESKTIHRLLEYEGGSSEFARNQDNTLQAGCVIVDETSMVDLMLMRSLLRAIEPGTRLILVGDADQLPSVGAGNVLGDILASGVLPCARLTDIYRQSEQSRIVTNAHRINHGQMPLLNEKGTDFFFERKDDVMGAARTIGALVSSRLPGFLKYPEVDRVRMAMTNIQVLTPTRKGDCGVAAMNSMLQQLLNPPAYDRPSMEYGGIIFRKGDKVIQLHNDYEQEWRQRVGVRWEDGKGVFNGDVGFITEVDTQNKCLTVLFDDNREAEYVASALQNLDLAYCLSVHKSQGSEFPVVVMPVVGGPTLLLTRNLLYTAMTRARTMVVLVGREEVIRQMVENDYILHRYTTLAERLTDRTALLSSREVWQ